MKHLRNILCPTLTINHDITILQTKSQCQVVDAPIKNLGWSKIVQNQSRCTSHTHRIDFSSTNPWKVWPCVSHESTAVNSAQHNIATGSSQLQFHYLINTSIKRQLGSWVKPLEEPLMNKSFCTFYVIRTGLGQF